jgi:hypothetical protein
MCGCREKRVQTKEKYKLRLTTKAYKLRLSDVGGTRMEWNYMVI